MAVNTILIIDSVNNTSVSFFKVSHLFLRVDSSLLISSLLFGSFLVLFLVFGFLMFLFGFVGFSFVSETESRSVT